MDTHQGGLQGAGIWQGHQDRSYHKSSCQPGKLNPEVSNEQRAHRDHTSQYAKRITKIRYLHQSGRDVQTGFWKSTTKSKRLQKTLLQCYVPTDSAAAHKQNEGGQSTSRRRKR